MEYKKKDEVRLVALCGFAGAGKDATAALLGMRGFERVAFADGVREEVEDFLSGAVVEFAGEFPKELWDLLETVTIEEVWGKPTSPKMRRVLQLWGTEFRRAQDSEYWIKKTEKKIIDLLYRGVSVVVTDMRFPNEVALVERLGGMVWRVDRPGLKSDGHVSEESVKTIVPDLILTNEGTLLDLAATLCRLL